jgi:hypothetical protein
MWNALWIDIGGGADFKLTPYLFIRGELLYSIRLPTLYENDGLEQIKKLLGDPNPQLGGLCSGPSIRLAAGYRFIGK